MPLSESFQLRLTQPQEQKLEEVMRATGMSKAEHIRRAVDYYLAGWRSGASRAAANVEDPKPERSDLGNRVPVAPVAEKSVASRPEPSRVRVVRR